MNNDWMQHPPGYVNPEEARKAVEILKRPKGVPRDPQDVKDIPSTKAETIDTTPSRLDPEWAWFFPGLLYMVVGLDKSIFHLYSQWRKQEVAVKTYQSQELVAQFGDPRVDANPWLSLIQGVPVSEAQDLRGFIESFVFRRDKPQPAEYMVSCRKTRVADPFVASSPRKGVDITFLLPTSVLSGKQVIIAKEAGLTLETPVLSITQIISEK